MLEFHFEKKPLHTVLPSNGSAGDLQTIDYSYHIRGGLRGVNLDASGNLTSKMFSMKLGYEDANFFDGNIGKQEWKTSLDNVTRSYTFSYDGASRITGGSYVGRGSENYSLNAVSYDLNGNITTLSRNGLKSNNSFGLIDNLAYTYNSNSNEIQKVDDTSNETASFTDVSGNDYTYSLDGSLTSDANKGITSIEYNYLKRPKKYTFSNGSTLENQYDATGKKLKSISSDGTTYDFLGNLIYKNNVLYQISHDEGRIINGEYEYEIKDHLGNLRVSFRDSLGVAKITQKQDYDIYGSELQGLSYTKPLWNQDNFKYLGRESISQTGYIDLLNRQYDRILGRFTSPDPVTDGQEDQSLYQYGWNNPVLRSDADGLYPCCGDFLNGVGNGFVGTFQAIGNAIAHPINTFNNAAQSNAAAMKADPVGSVLNQAISASPELSSVREAYQFGKALAAGNSYGAGQMAGGKLAEATIVVATEGAGRAVGGIGKVAQVESNITSVVQKGRLGNTATRNQVDNIATTLESRGYEITGGGGRVSEEFLKPVGGAKKGGSYPDITATKGGRTIRINTVDTRANGLTPSTREATNAARIRQQTPGDHLILIPKQ